MDQNYENESGSGKKTLWIIGGIILVVMIIALVYGATQKNLSGEIMKDSSEKSTPIVSSSTTGQTMTSQEVLGITDRIEVIPSLVSMDLVNLETIPYQAQARISGTVPDGCSQFDTPTTNRIGNIITISLTASHAKDATCSQAPTKRSVIVQLPVAGLDEGNYIVTFGTISKTLTLSTAKALQYTDDK